MKAARVPNDLLLDAGVRQMAASGMPLARVETKGRSMIYRTPSGRSVRVRTCNDHVLVVVAESPEPGARLNIEGTDDILIVMPEVPRSPGPVISYLVPTKIAVDSVRNAHETWLASNPNTQGDNRTWNVWFGDRGLSSCTGFAAKWAQYRLQSEAVTNSSMPSKDSTGSGSVTLGDVIAEAKRKIAQVAGVSESAVRISLDLG